MFLGLAGCFDPTNTPEDSTGTGEDTSADDTQVRPIVRRPTEVVIAFTVFGLLAGALFGERGVNWIGRKLRDRENG